MGSEHLLCLCMLRARAIQRARSVHGTYRVRPQVIFLLGISLRNAVIWKCFVNDQRRFLKKKIFFHLRVPPLVFGYLSDSVLADPGGKSQAINF